MGNEKADEGAKKAARQGSSGKTKLLRILRKDLPISSMAIKQEKLEEIAKEAKRYFKASPCY